MSRHKKDPLRELTAEELRELNRIARSQATPAAELIRAEILLAVAQGDDYRTAARPPAAAPATPSRTWSTASTPRARPRCAPPRRRSSRDLWPGGPGADHRRGRSDTAPEGDGTATWSLSTLRRALRTAPDGLPGSRPTPSGACSASPGPATSAAVPGARRAPPCGCRAGSPSGRQDGPGCGTVWNGPAWSVHQTGRPIASPRR